MLLSMKLEAIYFEFVIKGTLMIIKWMEQQSMCDLCEHYAFGEIDPCGMECGGCAPPNYIHFKPRQKDKKQKIDDDFEDWADSWGF